MAQANRAFLRRAVQLPRRRRGPAVPRHRLGHPDRRQRARDRPAGRTRRRGWSTSTSTRWRSAHSREILAGNDRRRGDPGGPARPGGDPRPPRVRKLLDFEPAGRAAARRGPALRPGRTTGRRVVADAARRAGARQLPGARRTAPTRAGRRGRAEERSQVYRRHRQPAARCAARAEVDALLRRLRRWSTRAWSGCRSGGPTHRTSVGRQPERCGHSSAASGVER